MTETEAAIAAGAASAAAANAAASSNPSEEQDQLHGWHLSKKEARLDKQKHLKVRQRMTWNMFHNLHSLCCKCRIEWVWGGSWEKKFGSRKTSFTANDVDVFGRKASTSCKCTSGGARFRDLGHVQAFADYTSTS